MRLHSQEAATAEVARFIHMIQTALKKSKIDTDSKADAISVYKDKIALLDGNTANVYNTKGDKVFATETGAGSKNIILSSDTTAYVLSVNQIRFIELNNNQKATEKVATDDKA